jgi:predicted cupin superfamily sugar epimerase
VQHLENHRDGQQRDYRLVNEAVSPGFDFADMQLGNREKLGEAFPEHWALIEQMNEDQG